ncbi:MAG: AAA family ATPase [Planctomycetaceae bacterium]|nr:AAA family ATPase [Planctomycetaceae bacterium]
MLISFSVSNFRSFGEEQTLNMVASNKLTDHPNHLVPIGKTGKNVLRTAVVYGANAAGKSNLVRAMAFAQRAILGSERRVTIPNAFRFGSDPKAGSTSFEFRFLKADRVFVYGFDASMFGFLAEWLCVVDGDDEIVIFERDQDGAARLGPLAKSRFPDDPTLVETLGALTKLPLRPIQLLLTRAYSLPENVQGITLRSVIKWLTEDLVILPPNHREFGILDRLSKDVGFFRLAEGFLRSIGTGVASLELQQREFEVGELKAILHPRKLARSKQSERFDEVLRDSEDPTKRIFRRLIAKHSSGSSVTNLPFSEESDGTKQLLHLMPVLAAFDNEAKVVVIDELDRSLHPLICWEFIRLFSETLPNVPKQLIVTTHEVHLLNQELLRRDEYWFVEKDSEQQSRLVSLSEFQVRKDLQIEKSYLQGRFGAIPVIGSMAELEKLLQTPKCSEAADAPQETSP